jgi:hypothetical protein
MREKVERGRKKRKKVERRSVGSLSLLHLTCGSLSRHHTWLSVCFELFSGSGLKCCRGVKATSEVNKVDRD